MIDAIRASFKKGLPDLDWMDDKTRRAAEDKVLFNNWILPQRNHARTGLNNVISRARLAWVSRDNLVNPLFLKGQRHIWKSLA